MKWRKAPEELKTILDLAMQGLECEKRLMFGYPAYFLNRNMFIGLYQDQLFMRLPPTVISSLKERAKTAIRNLEPMPGRPMKDYFVIPRDLCMDRDQLRTLATQALEHTRTLKPKQPRAATWKTPQAKAASPKAKPSPKPGEGNPRRSARGKP